MATTQEALRGYEETTRPQPEAFRVAVVEAEGLGMKALGSDYAKYNQTVARRNTSYRGKIVAENEIFVVQKLSPRDTVRHLKRDLPKVPQIGQDVRIGYSASLAKITDVPKHDQKRKHRLAL
jgi:hypothetical protein